ncbi:histidine kinase [Oscillatoriales cyanobacterium USR001]|nr:histidine kinase [Oscillatoriales cyanobacterium USR001]
MNLVENTQELQQRLDREVLLRRIVKRIRQSLKLSEILNCTVEEIREFLETDRIMIYRFNSDSSGEVIAESINKNRLPSLKSLNFPADDIPVKSREMYVKLRQRTIVDVASGLIGVSHLNFEEIEGRVTKEEIEYKSVDPCHISYLKAMGVQSSLVVPILLEKRNQDFTEYLDNSELSKSTFNATFKSQVELWGLLVSHHSEAKQISEADLQIVQLVVDQVSIAIAHSNILTETRDRALREATVNQVSTLLHDLPTIQLQAALEVTVNVLQGTGGRIYIKSKNPTIKNENISRKEAESDRIEFKNNRLYSSFEIFSCGEQPNLELKENRAIEEHPLWQEWLKSGFNQIKEISRLISADYQLPIWKISDLYKEPLFRVLVSAFRGTKIRGLLVIPLYYRQQLLGCLTIFRNEIETERLWAGRFESDAKQQLPRQSFEVWRETKKGQSRDWTNDEIDQAKAISQQFSMAIYQYVLYKEVQNLNANLERQVQERTVQLQQSLEFAKVLGRVTDQLRSTLDLKIILQTIVREVQTLLNTDRVVIYQFIEDKQGEVVVEELAPLRVTKGNLRSSILGMKAPTNCFPEESACLYRQGRVQAINDIYQQDLTPCHREFLESLQVRASLIVPIATDVLLWGLLIAHECAGVRVWQDSERNLLQQLAHQAAIAIQQAELYQASQAAAIAEQIKAEQLGKTIGELRQTQAQLIQTEKMSGLGQLVAGVAHEINNPVNFIYGNISHVTEYSTDLMKLLKLYQQKKLEPDEEIINCAEEIDLDFIAEDLPKILDSMKMGAERIRQLVLSLRNFSRLDQAEKKAVDIHEGIESTLVILQHRLKAKPERPAIELIKDYGNLPLVECYAGLLNQVFMNIISNAVDALEIGIKDIGSRNKKTAEPDNLTDSSMFFNSNQSPFYIQISTEAMGTETVVISIKDNGTGIPPELVSQVFNPFFTTKPVGQGTGLGLSISYQIIVEKHKGKIRCVSQPGQGTEFIIEIPVH